MEVRVYRDIQSYNGSKPVYCVRVFSPDVFSFENAISLFKSIYGPDVIIVFVCV